MSLLITPLFSQALDNIVENPEKINRQIAQRAPNQAECDPFQDCQRDFCHPPSLQEERDLLDGVYCESRRLYFSLDCEGKNKAIYLLQLHYDKNMAIQEAAKDMARRQLEEYPNQNTYQKQIQERSGQYLYNDRFGY